VSTIENSQQPGPDEPHDLRTRFIRAAMEILAEPETPLDLRKVAERAGKSRTAPYLVFGKEREGGGLAALRLAVAAEGTRMLCGRLEEAWARAEDALGAFHGMAKVFLTFAEEHPRLYRLMFGPEIGGAAGASHSAEETTNEVGHLLQARAELERLSRSIITESQEAGLIPPGETLRTSWITWATLHGLALLRMDGQLGLAGIEHGMGYMVGLASEAVLGVPTDTMEGVALTLLKAQRQREVASSAPADEQAPIVREMADSRWTLSDRSDEGASESAPEHSADHAPEPRPEKAGEGSPEQAGERSSFYLADGPVDLDMAAPSKIDAWQADHRTRAEPSPSTEERSEDRETRPAPSAHGEKAQEPAMHSYLPPVPERLEDSGPDLTSRVISDTRALRRAARSSRSFRGARILWIDDHPDWIEWERRTIEQLGAEIEVVEATQSALARLRSSRFDLIVSDIARGDRKDAGVADLAWVRAVSGDTPVVFYVAVTDESLEVPEGAWGVTNRPEELLHLVMDVLERSRG